MEQDNKNINQNQENTEFEVDKEEIEFDDNIDIGALQAQLQEHMQGEDIDYTPEQVNIPVQNSEEVPVLDNTTPTTDATPQLPEVAQPTTPLAKQKAPEEKLKLKEGEKKYVIYIEPDNIDFINSLSIKERKKLINKILHEQDEYSQKRREMRERSKFTKQIIIMVLTVTLSLPIFFVLLNKSIEITILNYQQAQQNFVKLYKEQGKIKSYKTFQNHFR